MEMSKGNDESLVGAQKRKSYRKHSVRSTTPADSGFIERSPTLTSHESSPLTNDCFKCKVKIEVDSSIFPNTKEQPAAPKAIRTSARLLKIKEEKVTHTPMELLLKFVTEENDQSQAQDPHLAMARFLPNVVIKKLTESQVAAVLDDWTFLNRTRIIDKIMFRCEIIAKQKNPAEEEAFLVQFTHPSGIKRISWMKKDEVPIEKTKIVDVQNLSWSEKLLVRNQLITKC